MPEPLRIFIGYVHEDLAEAIDLYERLKKDGYIPWIAEKDLLPGDPLESAKNVVPQADVVVFLLSQDSTEVDVFAGTANCSLVNEIHGTYRLTSAEALKIPVLLSPLKMPRELEQVHPVRLYEDDGYGRLLEALRRFEEARSGTQSAVPPSVFRNLTISGLSLRNIRCFETLDLDFEDAGWVTVLGDNATGKSTILRSLALGLCNETDSVALMKEVPGTFLRQGADEGSITLRLVDTISGDRFEIETTVEKEPDRPDEAVRKHTRPEKDFPWSDLFVCAYGTQRSRPAHAGYERYSVRDAVATLFDDGASLQNPELMLLRQPPEVRQKMERRLLDVLMLDDSALTYDESRTRLQGPWGEQAFPCLSDGYRSTSQWLLDFMAWLIQAGRLNGDRTVGGVLILDEIEQHLHPRWQRWVAQKLRRQFPQTQIIVSTHTPLVATGGADIEASKLFRLAQEADGPISSLEIPRGELAGLRADQVLASDAFGLATSRSPGSVDDLERYAELKGQATRTDAESAELEALSQKLQEAFRFGETDYERKAQQIVDVALKKMADDEDPELLDLEIRRRLKEIFGPDEDD